MEFSGDKLSCYDFSWPGVESYFVYAPSLEDAKKKLKKERNINADLKDVYVKRLEPGNSRKGDPFKPKP